MRLFIAIQFSDDIKKGLISVMHELKKKNVGGNYSPAENLHLTLAFIGETQNAEGVKRAMEAAAFAPFMLSLTELGNFSLKRPASSMTKRSLSRTSLWSGRRPMPDRRESRFRRRR